MMVTAAKTSLKKEAALLQTLSGLFCLVQFAKCWQFVLELKFKDCIEVQEKKKKVIILCSHPPQNVKLVIFML